uniref:Uncharacterized protein n=2 Tax=Candidatus Kentrum sp. UNK TaxID=2126344 RepID=A0A451A4I8_9GAMM|nr:MAG: hypothetical protein BECKUNK1418G_GA0071005_101443 [Candidatus Kentron sp. UNK]
MTAFLKRIKIMLRYLEVSEKHIWSAPECKEKSSEGKDEVLHTYIRPLDEALASGPDGICVFQT